MDDSYCLLPERISEQFSEIDSDIVMDYPFHLRVFPNQRADGGCRQAAGGIRAAPPGEGGEAHGQGYKNKSFCEKRH